MKHTKYLLLLLLLLWQAFVNAQIKVACIGNSITWGDGLDPLTESYPIQLKALLQTQYPNKLIVVENYGVSGTTMLKDLNLPTTSEKQKPYWKEKKFASVIAWEPDIVIIKFGTNDSRIQNWPATEEDGKNNFYPAYVEFINILKGLKSKPEIYICYPIPFHNRPAQAKTIVSEVIPLIKQVALTENVGLIDLHSVFKKIEFDNTTGNMVMDPTSHINEYYSDNVHPTKKGAELIAQEVFRVLKAQSKLLNQP